MKNRLILVASVMVMTAPVANTAEFRVLDTQGNAVANAVVMIDGKSGEDGHGQTASIEQRQQQFSPRVTVIRQHGSIEFPNRDLTLHHVYSFSEARSFELQLYAGDDAEPVVFDETGIVALGCNIHDWMLGFIVVTDASSFGITDASGYVSIKSIANDAESLSVWHPALLNQELTSIPLSGLSNEITVELSQTDPLAFEIDPLQSLFDEAGE